MRIHVLSLVMVIAGTIFLTACPERTKIADLNANPGRYSGKDVVVAGTVRDSYGFSVPGIGGGGAYKIDDGTDSIWVLVTDGSIPQNGMQVGIKGRLGTGLTWRGRNYGLGIYEKDRRIRGR